MALAVAGCAGPGNAAFGAAALEPDVPYRPGSPHPKHRLDLYRPSTDRAPIVIFVHGGYWVSGDRRAPQHGAGLYRNVGSSLAARGILTLVPSYRLSPEVAIDAMVEDIEAVVAWALEHGGRHGGDPSRLTLVGHSAGGHLAAMVGIRARERFAGIGVLSGIWDVAAMRRQQPTTFNASVTTPVFGDGVHDASWSPLGAAARGPNRWLVLVAEDDFAYLHPQATAASQSLTNHGRSVRHVVAAGYRHLDVVRRFGEPGDVVAPAVSRLAFGG